MFGYVKPDTPYLYIKDDTLYKSLYCSVCKSIGKICGQRARLGLTYDIAFMSAFIHNVAGVDVKIEKKHCIAHPITSRPIADRDDITDFCACASISGSIVSSSVAERRKSAVQRRERTDG